MPVRDHQELRTKQMELFVCQQIMTEFRCFGEQELYIDTLPMNSNLSDNPTFRDFTYQENGLKQLVATGLIRILNTNETLKTGIHIRIVDVAKFDAFYTELFESIPAVGNGARIVYSMTTGKGKINGETFRFKGSSRNRRVFEYLVQNPNKRISKQKLWSATTKKGEYTKDNVFEFNDTIANLREALNHISPQDLYLKKTVMLKAEVTLL